MHVSSIIVASAVAALQIIPAVHGHTFLDRLQQGNCVRKTAAPPETKNFPIKDLASQDMVCGKAPTQSAGATCPIQAGKTLALIWGHNTPQDDVIDPSHRGPCNVYLAPLNNNQLPSGNAWFKIFEQGFSKGKWCTDNLIANKGVLNVPVPAGVASGKYVMRAEINALHEADVLVGENPNRGAQFYVFCAEIEVSGGQNGTPSPLVSIPGHLNPSSPGVKFNVFGTPGEQYPTLGPKVAAFGGKKARRGLTLDA